MSRHYILVNGQETGPFDDEELEDIQSTAEVTYKVLRTIHDNGVVELDNLDDNATVCYTCGRAWDDTVSTHVTPTPAGRCPFEYEHPEPKPTINRSSMWLVYKDDAGMKHYQHWNDTVDSGTLIDPFTGDDMELVGWTTDNPNA